MSISTPFINRPVATTLLTLALALAGAIAYTLLPVSPLPQVEFPTISVSAALPGASPETMASSIATPLERQFGRIAGVTEMTSTSYLGSTSITLQFDLNRNIDAAARDVQAAINAARGQLPTNLPNNPTYRKVNPADAPILFLALTSPTMDTARLYDAASSILQQKLSQVTGVGQVFVGGGALPAVRVDVNPTLLNNYGLNLEDVRTMLGSANANRPKGNVAIHQRSWELTTTDQLLKASDYKPLLVAYKNGGAVVLSDVASVTDSVEDIRAAGYANGKPAILVIIFRQPGANIIATVDHVRSLLPQLKAAIPAAIDLSIVLDRSTTIRASVEDVEFTLMISIGLVILVVFVFLRSVRTTIIPSVAVPVSLVGTFAVMYLLGYSVDNLSLMALTIATGFVVDDAIVVIENITRYLEQGMAPMEAALKGAAEIGFTVLSISISLVAVFIPILMMGGIVGRLFREFAVTLSVAIAISLVISLTTTPMMCALLLRSQEQERHGRIYRLNEWVFNKILRGYELSLQWVLRHQPVMLLVTLATIGLTIYLYIAVPKGFFPQQDTGRLSGQILADQSTSFEAMRGRLLQFANVVMRDPAAGKPHRLYRRFRRGRPRDQYRDHVRDAEAVQPAQQGHRRSGDRALARSDSAHPGRNSVPAARAGSAHRRTRQRRAVSIHLAERERPGSQSLGADCREQTAVAPANRRLEFRPAKSRPASFTGNRPCYSSAAGRLHPAHRQHPLRRLRPAPGLHHVSGAQSISRGDGS